MKFAIASALAFATLATATHTVTVTSPPPNQTPPPASQCNTDHLYCCNQSQLGPANNSIIAGLLAVIGVVVQPITALVGANCTPIDILGIGSGGQCTQQPVCCQNNDFAGAIVIGCSPVTVGL